MAHLISQRAPAWHGAACLQHLRGPASRCVPSFCQTKGLHCPIAGQTDTHLIWYVPAQAAGPDSVTQAAVGSIVGLYLGWLLLPAAMVRHFELSASNARRRPWTFLTAGLGDSSLVSLASNALVSLCCLAAAWIYAPCQQCMFGANMWVDVQGMACLSMAVMRSLFQGSMASNPYLHIHLHGSIAEAGWPLHFGRIEAIT